MERLKKTHERLSGPLSDTILNQGEGLNGRIQKPLIKDQKNPQITIITPKTEKAAPGTIPNLQQRLQDKPSILNVNQERIVIALAKDHMPCVVLIWNYLKQYPMQVIRE